MNEPRGPLLRAGGCVRLPAEGTPQEATADDYGALPLSLPEGLEARPARLEKRALTVHDSWPWSLWYAGRALVGDGRRLTLFDLTTDEQAPMTVDLRRPPPSAKDLPPDLERQVSPLLGIRALLPRAKLHLEQRWWSVRNADDKIVVRILDQRWSERCRTLQVVALRGYEEDAEAVRAAAEAGWWSPEAPVLHALRDADLAPRPWSSKPSFTIAAEQPMSAATAEYLQLILQTARETEAGIIADHDIEFLHDYRVLVRRARSVLKVLSGVFSPATTADLKESFRTLGQETNLLRDLDVHLFEQNGQRARVPEWLTEDLDPLFSDLRARRDAEQRRLARKLRSRAYRELVHRLDIALATPEPGPAAQAEVHAFARQKLRKAMKRVLERGRSITPETPDATVHELRVDAKRLRYTVDLFKGALNPDAAAALIKRLKKFQDVLGRFNDLSVQQDALRAWVAERRDVPRETALAVGALIGGLRAEQAAVRRKVESSFQAFDHPDVKTQFDRMLALDEEARG